MSSGEFVVIIEVTDPDESLDTDYLEAAFNYVCEYVLQRCSGAKVEVREVERA